MAKTTRKTESATAAKKPATRRATAASAAEGAEKVTIRRRAKTAPEAANAEPPSEQAFASEPTHDEIALRAWSIYQRRGASHGQAMSDWLEAKAQLLAERGIEP